LSALITCVFIGCAEETHKRVEVAEPFPIFVRLDEQSRGTSVVDSNGLACEAWLNNRPHGSNSAPYCETFVTSKTNISLPNFWTRYQPTYLRARLVNQKGEDVELTGLGRQIGIVPNRDNLITLYKSRRKMWINGRARTPGLRTISPLKERQLAAGFYVQDFFKINEPGGYTLRVQMPLFEVTATNANIIWLPEVSLTFELKQ
jgi:hypothetical protein